MTVTYQLTENEFDYRLFRKIKSQLLHRSHSAKIKIEIEDAETDETDVIMANPAYYQELIRRKASVEAGNVITFTPQQFDELVKEHSI